MQALKIILIGDTAVGKSQLSRCVLNKEFQCDSPSTLNMEFQSKKFAFEKCDVVSQIWDTAGQERFASMTRAYYRNAVAAILVYDVCNRDSLVRLETVWLPELREFGHNGLRCILVGNKCDKTSNRDVTAEEGIAFAEKHNLDFVECSALTKQNVEKMFRRISLSVAKLLPDVKQNLELLGLPDGWLAVMPESLPELTHKSSGDLNASPGSSLEAAKSTGSKGNSYDKNPSISESPETFRPIGIDGAANKQRRTSLKRETNATPVAKSLLAPKVKYINFWTGEECEDLPTAPADPGLLHVYKPPPPPVATPSPERRPSNHKSLSNNSVNNAFDDIEVAPTERSSSVSNRSRSVSLTSANSPSVAAKAVKDKSQKSRWCCVIL